MSGSRLESVLEWIDEANAADPNMDESADGRFPRELLYGHRMSAWLERVSPASSEPLKIAARGQHICRWEVPRDCYPANREGYLRWRTYLYGFHAGKVAELMERAEYDRAAIDRARTLIQKRGIKTDAEVQVLEDVICLVFLENYFAGFAAAHEADKLVTIVRKTWSKMSDQGHELALQLQFPESVQPVLAIALGAD